MNARILLVDNDTSFATKVEQLLEDDNYCVNIVNSGFSGLRKVRESNPDLLLLSWDLTDISGLEVCQHLRLSGNEVPIMLFNDRDTVSDRVIGLDAGADDYLIKPINSIELSARVRALLRRIRRNRATSVLRLDNLVLDPEAREVYRGDHLINLTAKEFDLLAYFMQNPQRVITRDQILENVWQYEYIGNSNIIEVYIRYLRRKLEAHQEERLIHTIRGVGYMMREPKIKPLPLSA
jgi:DNA-binding response OmpR family regulator